MSTFKSIKELTEKALSSTRVNLEFGIKEFQKLHFDIYPGQVFLVGARPTVGRTMFMLFLFYRLWRTNMLSQVFVSNEEDELQLYYKFIATVQYFVLLMVTFLLKKFLEVFLWGYSDRNGYGPLNFLNRKSNCYVIQPVVVPDVQGVEVIDARLYKNDGAQNDKSGEKNKNKKTKNTSKENR